MHNTLEQGQTKSGQLGDWLVKKNIFICMQSKKLQKLTHVEIQNYFQNFFYFYDSLYGF